MPDGMGLELVVAAAMGGLATMACYALGGRSKDWLHGWRALGWLVLATLWAMGGAAFAARFTRGLGAVTHLSDTFPWGLWIAFDMLGGVALAAGGFLMAGAVYVFRLERFHSILRPAILTAYLGYLLAVGGLLADLGRPYNIWHPIVYWQHRSVMFEVAWCVTLYTTVLTLEFLPLLLERFRWARALRLVRAFTAPLVIAGIILSTLHQSSLGSLFLIVPQKLLQLWYTPLLPLFFFMSALAVGMAMLIFESTVSARAFGRSLHRSQITALARAMPVVLVPYLLLRVLDITWHDGWAAAFQHPLQGATFLVEMLLLLVPTLVLLRAGWVGNAKVAFWASMAVVVGVVLNRLNVCWIGMLPSAEIPYVPSWREIVITVNLLSYGIVLFGLAARYLPLFEEHD
ncbi:MAG: Ni/Fe-hydrogenase cytochrome b subunit [Acidobacteria bacterium]|nr:Ni/Fe-hydrogenase cytochrome b subunit [Acidobacteriota bacterium]